MRPRPLLSSDRSETDESLCVRTSETRGVQKYECDSCGGQFEGEPASSGLFIWARGGEVRYEEPPLCEDCSSKVTLGALLAFEPEDEEEG